MPKGLETVISVCRGKMHVESARMQIICDHLLGVILECQKAQIAEQRFEYGGRNVRPVQHPFEFRAIDHVTFERGQKYLRCVGENDDAQRYRKVLHVDAPLDFRPAPIADL